MVTRFEDNFEVKDASLGLLILTDVTAVGIQTAVVKFLKDN